MCVFVCEKERWIENEMHRFFSSSLLTTKISGCAHSVWPVNNWSTWVKDTEKESKSERQVSRFPYISFVYFDFVLRVSYSRCLLKMVLATEWMFTSMLWWCTYSHSNESFDIHMFYFRLIWQELTSNLEMEDFKVNLILMRMVL